MMNDEMNPDTNCPHCGAEIAEKFPSMGEEIYKCGSWNRSVEADRTDLCREREAHNKTKDELETMKGEATREIMLRDKIEKRCEIAEAKNQKLRELLQATEELMQHYHDCISNAAPFLSIHHWSWGDAPKRSEELKARRGLLLAEYNTLIYKPRQYFHPNGNPIALLKLIKAEPEWAENQIRHRDKLERELAEKTNEVNNWHQHYRDEASKAQKLKQAFIALSKAAQAVIDRWETPLWKDAEPTASVIYRLRDALATAPDGKTCEGLTDPEARKRYAALAPAPEEPVIQKNRITEPADHCVDANKMIPDWIDANKMIPDWRELGEDEVIQEGDEYQTDTSPKHWPVSSVMIGKIARHFNYSFRTRRPLPVQEEMPLEDELMEIENISKGYASNPIASCIRYLRDEIQKLKEAR